MSAARADRADRVLSKAPRHWAIAGAHARAAPELAGGGIGAAFMMGTAAQALTEEEKDDRFGPECSSRSTSIGREMAEDLAGHHVESDDEGLPTPEVRAWEPERWEMVGKLQDAARNRGQVFVMRDRSDGNFVAVKHVPNSWIASSQAEFLEENPNEIEMPWADVWCLVALGESRFPYVCKLIGVFRTEMHTNIVTELASEGDLFTWSSSPSSEPAGFTREALHVPIAMQLLDAVTRLHGMSIVHGDLSLENVLLHRSSAGALPDVRLIDFGMSSTCRIRTRAVGKAAYQAPEMHSGLAYDGFQSDAFAVGVVLYTLLMKDYPWSSTQPGVCKGFSYFATRGFHAFIQKRTVRGTAMKAAQLLSEPFVQLLEGLLALDPLERHCLLPAAAAQGRKSVWQEPLVQYGCRFLVPSPV